MSGEIFPLTLISVVCGKGSKHGGGNVMRFCRGYNGVTRFSCDTIILFIGQIFVKFTDGRKG